MKQNIEKVIEGLTELHEELKQFQEIHQDNEEIQKAFRNINRFGIEPAKILEDAQHLKVFIEGFTKKK
jgi:hypothetical protein